MYFLRVKVFSLTYGTGRNSLKNIVFSTIKTLLVPGPS